MKQEFKSPEELLKQYSVPEESMWTENEIMSFLPDNIEHNDAVVIQLGQWWSKIAVACAIIFALSFGNLFFQNDDFSDDPFVSVDDLTADEAHLYLTLND